MSGLNRGNELLPSAQSNRASVRLRPIRRPKLPVPRPSSGFLSNQSYAASLSCNGYATLAVSYRRKITYERLIGFSVQRARRHSGHGHRLAPSSDRGSGHGGQFMPYASNIRIASCFCLRAYLPIHGRGRLSIPKTPPCRDAPIQYLVIYTLCALHRDRQDDGYAPAMR